MYIYYYYYKMFDCNVKLTGELKICYSYGSLSSKLDIKCNSSFPYVDLSTSLQAY